MGAQGSVEIDFGAWPGAVEDETDVSATGVIVTSLVEAWLVPLATADHTVDEHIAMIDSLRVQARYLSNDNIRIRVQPVYPEQMVYINPEPILEAGQAQKVLTYGKWNVGWVWNALTVSLLWLSLGG